MSAEVTSDLELGRLGKWWHRLTIKESWEKESIWEQGKEEACFILGLRKRQEI